MCTASKEQKFLDDVKKNTNDQVEIISEFLGKSKPITYRCKVCNNKKTIKCGSELLRKERKNPCRNCLMQKIATERSKQAKKKIISKIKEYPSLIIKKMYKQQKETDKRWIVGLECGVCEHTWESSGTNITRSNDKWKGCPDCWMKNEDRIEKHTGYLLKAKVKKEAETKQSFMVYIKTRKDIKMTGMYINKKTTTKFKCMECNFKWGTSPAHIHISGSGCPQCKSGVTKARETYLDDVYKQHGMNIEVLGEYINATTKIEHLCHKCDKVFKSAPGCVRKGTGCPNCRISKGEERIRRYLEEVEISFIREWREHNCKYYMTLPMDFYLPDFNTVIEFQGIQHRKFSPYLHKTESNLLKQQKRDQIKRKYCEENGLKFIEIWYDEMESIEKILSAELFKNIHKAS